jgi:SSS family solute:Na+ symporter
VVRLLSGNLIPVKLHPVDIVVIIVYFALTVAFALRISLRNKNADRYFLGGRDFPGWAIGISFVGAMISSVTFIALPADSFKTTWVRYIPYLGFPLLILISVYVFIPFFRRGTLTSAYQYLSLRFGPSISAYGACVFLAAQIIRTASVVYLMAVLMAALTGLSVEWSILIAGGITALYTVKGGFEAVIWTDVIQTFVLILGALVIIAVIVGNIPGGFWEILREAMAADKFSIKDLNPATGALEPVATGFSFTEKTVTMLILVGLTQYIAGKLNQESVQRWCSSRSSREATKSMVVLGVCSLPIWAAFMFMGTALWVYYQHFPDETSLGILGGTLKAEGILPHFIITVLPPGLSGVVISAALAAAMSTLSSAINSGSMVLVHDLYKKYLVKTRDNRHYLRAGRLASLLVSALMVGGAFVFHLSDTKTLNDFTIIITAILGGGIAGMFLFGMLCRRGDARAVLAGIAATVAFTIYALLMQYGALPRVFDPYYTAIIGNAIMVVVCYAASWIFKTRPRDLTNLTVWDRTPGSVA